MSLKLPSIYAITDTRISGLSHIEQVRLLISGGIRCIQLRDKHVSSREFYEAAKVCAEITKSEDVILVINDRVDIALAVKADGVHLGQQDLSPEYARKILDAGCVIGYSTHSFEQFVHASRLPIDYLAIGPIFQTTTKSKPDPVTGTGIIRQVKAAFPDIPLVAIGGIGPEELDSVFSSGADSAAVIGTLLKNPANITKAAEKLISLANTAKSGVKH